MAWASIAPAASPSEGMYSFTTYETAPLQGPPPGGTWQDTPQAPVVPRPRGGGGCCRGAPSGGGSPRSLCSARGRPRTAPRQGRWPRRGRGPPRPGAWGEGWSSGRGCRRTRWRPGAGHEGPSYQRALRQTSAGPWDTARTLAGHVDEVTQLVALRLQVAPVVGVGCGHQGHAGHHLQAISLQSGAFLGIIGEEAYLLEAQVHQYLHADAVIAPVGGKAERLVGLHRVQPQVLLEGVGAYLVTEADAAALLAHVDEHPATLGGDAVEGKLDLVATVAAQRVEDVAGDALGVNAHQDGFRRRDVTHHQGGVLVGVNVGAVGEEAELTAASGHSRLGDAVNQSLAPDAVADDLRDSDDLDSVAFGEAFEVRQARHRAIGSHDLAEGAHGLEPGHAAEVHGGLRVTGADQHTAVANSQGIDVARHRQVAGLRIRIGQDLDGARSIGGRHAGGNTPAGVHGDGESGTELGLVLLLAHHPRDVQLIEPLPGHGHANDASRVLEHEADGLWSHKLGGDGQIALVFTALVIDDDDHSALAISVDRLLDGGQGRAGFPSRPAVLLDGLYHGEPPAKRSGPAYGGCPCSVRRPLSLSLRE